MKGIHVSSRIRVISFVYSFCMSFLLYIEANIGNGFYYDPVIAAQQDALQQKNNVHKMQEAKAAANKYEGLASQKRQRAQMLMENADLATYKAMMALRIAEAAAQVDESPEIVIASILD